MGILSWIVIGLIVGALAKLLMPGDDGGGFITTTLLGIAGAFLGGAIGTQLGVGAFEGFDPMSMALAVGGAFLLLLAKNLIFKRTKSSDKKKA